MAVTQAQAPVYAYQYGTTSLSLTLGSAPTVGNLMVVDLNGGTSGTGPTGWTLLFNNGATTNNDSTAWYRVVQVGDTAGPYVFTVAATYGTGGRIVELAGAGSSPTITYTSGDQTWTNSTHSIPNGSIAAPSGCYANLCYGLFTGSTTYTVGSDSFSAGTFEVAHQTAFATNNSYYGWGHQSFGSAGTCSITYTAPNVGISSGSQTVSTLIIASGTSSVNLTFTDTISAISDTLTPTITVSLSFTDTGPSFTDSLLVSEASGANFSFSDTISPINDYLFLQVFNNSGTSWVQSTHPLGGGGFIEVDYPLGASNWTEKDYRLGNQNITWVETDFPLDHP